MLWRGCYYLKECRLLGGKIILFKLVYTPFHEKVVVGKSRKLSDIFINNSNLHICMAREFNIIIEQGEDGYLISEVVELPGCHTQAKSYDELIKRTKEAISLY